jgi:sugar phosphate isomerase/epimerase
MMMETMRMFSLCSLTVLPCSPLEQIDAAAAACCDAVGLRLAPSMSTDVDILADRQLRGDIKKRLDETGIRVFDVEVARIVPSSDLDPLEPLLSFAGELGAQFLQVTGGPAAEWKPGDDEALLPKVQELADRAGEYGLSLALEFIVFRSLRTLSQALDLRTRSGRENIKVTLDALHFARSGGTIAELAAADPSAFACFHICDAPAEPAHDLARESRFGRLMPGAGGLPLREMLGLLPPGLPIGIEIPDRERDDLTPAEKARNAAFATRQMLTAAGISTKRLV